MLQGQVTGYRNRLYQKCLLYAVAVRAQTLEPGTERFLQNDESRKIHVRTPSSLSKDT